MLYVSLASGLTIVCFFFFSSRRRHTRWNCDWSSDVCSSDLAGTQPETPDASPRLGKRDDRDADPATSDPCPTVAIPTILTTPDPTVAVTVVQTPLVAPRLGKLDDRAPKTDNPGKRVGTVANPGPHLGVNHPAHPVNPKHVEPVAPAQQEQQPEAETPSVVPRLDKLDDRSAALPPATATPSAAAPATAVPATTPVTTPVTMPVTMPVATTTVSAPAP